MVTSAGKLAALGIAIIVYGFPYASQERATEHVRARRDVARDRQMRQERFDLWGRHRVGVPQAMKANVACDPVDVGLLGANREVLGLGQLMSLFEQFDVVSPLGWV